MLYIYFSSSLYILFGLNLSSVLYYRGLYSGCSIPILYIWIGCAPIIYSNNIVLGEVCGYIGSYIIEFNMLIYLGLYFNFLVFFLMPKPKGLGAFYKQLATITLIGNFTILLSIL